MQIRAGQTYIPDYLISNFNVIPLEFGEKTMRWVGLVPLDVWASIPPSGTVKPPRNLY